MFQKKAPFSPKKRRRSMPLAGFEFRNQDGRLQALYKADFDHPSDFYKERLRFKKRFGAGIKDIREGGKRP